MRGAASSERLSPEEYNAVIQDLVPLSIRLVDLNFVVKGPAQAGPLSTNAESEMPELGDQDPGEDGKYYVVIQQTSVFHVLGQDEAVAAEGRARFVVRLRFGFRPPDAFWPVFLRRNVPLYTHPVLRDVIASLVARANLVAQPLGSAVVVPLRRAAEEAAADGTKA